MQPQTSLLQGFRESLLCFSAPVQWQLFDLAQDPAEELDLAASQPAKTAELAARWAAWAERVGVQPR